MTVSEPKAATGDSKQVRIERASSTRISGRNVAILTISMIGIAYYLYMRSMNGERVDSYTQGAERPKVRTHKTPPKDEGKVWTEDFRYAEDDSEKKEPEPSDLIGVVTMITKKELGLGYIDYSKDRRALTIAQGAELASMSIHSLPIKIGERDYYFRGTMTNILGALQKLGDINVVSREISDNGIWADSKKRGIRIVVERPYGTAGIGKPQASQEKAFIKELVKWCLEPGYAPATGDRLPGKLSSIARELTGLTLEDLPKSKNFSKHIKMLTNYLMARGYREFLDILDDVSDEDVKIIGDLNVYGYLPFLSAKTYLVRLSAYHLPSTHSYRIIVETNRTVLTCRQVARILSTLFRQNQQIQ